MVTSKTISIAQRTVDGCMREAERTLWARVRNSQLAGYRFRQHQPLLGTIVDLYCAEVRVVIDLDPETGPVRAYDAEHTAELARHGIWVERFTDRDVTHHTSRVLARILAVLDARRALDATA